MTSYVLTRGGLRLTVDKWKRTVLPDVRSVHCVQYNRLNVLKKGKYLITLYQLSAGFYTKEKGMNK
jgi:hypothetical protein